MQNTLPWTERPTLPAPAPIAASVRGNRRRGRTLAVLGALLIALGVLSSASGSTGLPSGFTALSPAYKLQTNVTMGANAKPAFIVTGVSTTVPTYAPEVDVTFAMTLSAGSGRVTIGPNGDPGGAVTIAQWSSRTATTVNGSINVRVGTSNKIVISNLSAAAIKITTTVDGYRSSVVGPQGPTGATGPQGPAGPAGTLGDGSVTTSKIADGAVTWTKLAAGSVTTDSLVDHAVTSDKIETGAVTADKLDAGDAWHPVGYGSGGFITYSCGGSNLCEWKGAVSYRVDILGNVHIRVSGCWSMRSGTAAAGSGTCTWDTSGDYEPIFRLPTGYRPDVNLELPAAESFGTDANYPAAWFIGTGGSVSQTSANGVVGDPGVGTVSQELVFEMF